MRQLTRIAIGLGSNLGDREAFLRSAAASLVLDFLEDARSSSLYETEPWGVLDQPRFLNAVVVGWCEWKPPAIVNFLKQLERDLGRREGARFGPREIDLDLLAFGESIWASEGVSVPHPRLAERPFVVVPLAEVWPEWRHPQVLKTVSELIAGISSGPNPPLRVGGPLLG